MEDNFEYNPYLRVLLTLGELGLPPQKAADLVRNVPLSEIKETVIECIDDNATLGNLVDRFSYREIPIRKALYE